MEKALKTQKQSLLYFTGKRSERFIIWVPSRTDQRSDPCYILLPRIGFPLWPFRSWVTHHYMQPPYTVLWPWWSHRLCLVTHELTNTWPYGWVAARPIAMWSMTMITTVSVAEFETVSMGTIPLVRVAIAAVRVVIAVVAALLSHIFIGRFTKVTLPKWVLAMETVLRTQVQLGLWREMLI